MRILALALLAALPLAVGAQQMYKWVDEKGVTHYTDAPPPEGTPKSQKIDVRPTPPSGPASAPVDPRQKELDTRGDRLKKEQDARKATSDEERLAAQKQSRCLEAQRQLQILQMQRPIFQTNEKGERVYLDDKDRPAEIARWQEHAKAYCG